MFKLFKGKVILGIFFVFLLFFHFYFKFFIFQPKGERVTLKVLSKDDVLNYIFTLLAHKKTFIAACQLLEDMLQIRREVLDLHKICKFQVIIFLYIFARIHTHTHTHTLLLSRAEMNKLWFTNFMHVFDLCCENMLELTGRAESSKFGGGPEIC